MPGSLTKAALRQAALAARDALPPHDGQALAQALATLLAPYLPAVVGGYWPIGSEIDLRPALDRLRGAGAQIALPQTTPRGQTLIFRDWPAGAPLQPGRFGTVHPLGEPIVPALLLVPLLAFDRAGNRLGYGGGYYDRTLAAWPQALAVGCAYAAQERDAIPAEPHDRPLPIIATEQGVIHCRPGGWEGGAARA